MIKEEVMAKAPARQEASTSKAKFYLQLVKIRLTSLVVFSGCFGYLMAVGVDGFRWDALLGLAFGSFLVTGAANTFNQVIEQEHDKLMRRTADRPLPTSALLADEAVIFGFILMLLGSTILLAFTNAPAAFLSIVSLAAYAFVYTPLKRISPISVFVGAFPGAMPPLIGWVAGAGGLSSLGWALFAIQFVWQFPHFWAIAWLGADDYKAAGFKMLPFASGKSKETALLTFLITLLIVPVGLLPWLLGFTGLAATLVVTLAGVWFCMMSYRLLNQLNNASAKKLMFASFIYLPIVQIAFLVG